MLLGPRRRSLEALAITNSTLNAAKAGNDFHEVRQGQVWRLITPIFIHFGLLHILFNLWWLKDLGSMVEACQSKRQLLLLVVVIGIASNLGQYFWAGPGFGGMSGVVYGLLGYIWIRGKLDPGSGLFLNQVSLIIMLAWFFACLVGVIPHVANGTHVVGLVGGVLKKPGPGII